MTNRSRPLRTVSSVLLAGYSCGLLSGCIVMVVPAATSGIIARNVARRGVNANAAAGSANTANAGASPVPVQPVVAGGPLRSSVSQVSAQPKTQEVSALIVPGSSVTMTSPEPSSTASTWYDVIRFEAKTALGTPDERRVDILQQSENAPATSCGSRATAVLIDAATIGAQDYSYVGSLHTMGYAILLTTRSAMLPNDQVSALRKEGIPVPQSGVTLFPNAVAGDAGTRARILGRYCVVGLVGGQADDFPGSALPGTPKARTGWFLIKKPSKG